MSIIPIRLLAALGLAAALLFAIQQFLQHERDIGRQEQLAANEKAAEVARQAANREEDRRIKAQSENANEAQRLSNRSRNAAVAVAGATPGLLAALARSCGGAGSPNPAPVPNGPPTTDPAGMPTLVLGEIAGRLGALAAAADARGIAGQQCERDYDSLIEKVTP